MRFFIFTLLFLFFPLLSSYADNNTNKLPFSSLEKEAKRYQINPSPKSHYKLTFILKDAPGPFNKINAFATYEAPNCKFIHNKTAQAVSKPKIRVPIQLIKTSGQQYEAEFYTDRMKDEDYYGQGVCHWIFRGVSTAFIANDNDTDTWFSASILSRDLDAGKKEYAHLKEYYPVARIPRYLSEGLKKSAFTPDKYFTINIEIVKMN